MTSLFRPTLEAIIEAVGMQFVQMDPTYPPVRFVTKRV